MELVLEKTYSTIKSHRDNISLIQFWDNGITFIKIEDNVQVELKDSKPLFDFLNLRYDVKIKYKILVESGCDTSVSKEAKEFHQLRKETK